MLHNLKGIFNLFTTTSASPSWKTHASWHINEKQPLAYAQINHCWFQQNRDTEMFGIDFFFVELCMYDLLKRILIFNHSVGNMCLIEIYSEGETTVIKRAIATERGRKRRENDEEIFPKDSKVSLAIIYFQFSPICDRKDIIECIIVI